MITKERLFKIGVLILSIVVFMWIFAHWDDIKTFIFN